MYFDILVKFRHHAMRYSQYKILIAGRWSLEDLYVFPRAYEQVYFVLEALAPSEEPGDEERIGRAFNAFPWRGGYSAVSFYNTLRYATPKHFRPEIRAIKYASPGFIDLLLNLPQAIQAAAVVSAIAGAIGTTNKVYHDIHTGLQKRELLRIEIERKRLKLELEQLQFVQASTKKMATILGVKSVKKLNERTGDPLVSLKILLSAYLLISTEK